MVSSEDQGRLVCKALAQRAAGGADAPPKEAPAASRRLAEAVGLGDHDKRALTDVSILKIGADKDRQTLVVDHTAIAQKVTTEERNAEKRAARMAQQALDVQAMQVSGCMGLLNIVSLPVVTLHTTHT